MLLSEFQNLISVHEVLMREFSGALEPGASLTPEMVLRIITDLKNGVKVDFNAYQPPVPPPPSPGDILLEALEADDVSEGKEIIRTLQVKAQVLDEIFDTVQESYEIPEEDWDDLKAQIAHMCELDEIDTSEIATSLKDLKGSLDESKRDLVSSVASLRDEFNEALSNLVQEYSESVEGLHECIDSCIQTCEESDEEDSGYPS